MELEMISNNGTEHGHCKIAGK